MQNAQQFRPPSDFDDLSLLMVMSQTSGKSSLQFRRGTRKGTRPHLAILAVYILWKIFTPLLGRGTLSKKWKQKMLRYHDLPK